MVNDRRWLRQGILLDRAAARRSGTPTPTSSWIGLDPPQDRRSRPWRSTASRPPARSAPRILFVNQYYWPDHASTAQHLTDLAEFLAAQGFECHVLTSQGRYKPGEPTAGRL